ncbi:MAG: phosphohistidine phosphatase SixA [Methanophagales archaeon]|nr:phosphohistidine phosphatase SixA [Methanophagales archaeon]
MRLYLVQHGEAKKEEEDPLRPLSERGREDIQEIAKYAKKLDIKANKIFHSGKLRAKQTAEIVAKKLNIEQVIEAEELAPNADPKVWEDRLSAMDEDIIVVGHLPHLSKLSGGLLCGDEEKEVVAFRMGGIVCLERNKDGRWSVEWMITPEIVF